MNDEEKLRFINNVKETPEGFIKFLEHILDKPLLYYQKEYIRRNFDKIKTSN